MNVYILIFKSFSLMISLSAITASLIFYYQYKKPTALYYAGFLTAFHILMSGDWFSYLYLDFPEVFEMPFLIIPTILGVPVGIYFCYFGITFVLSLFGKRIHKILTSIIILYNVILIPLYFLGIDTTIMGTIEIIITSFFMIIYVFSNFRNISDKMLRRGVKSIMGISIIFFPVLFLFFYPQLAELRSILLTIFFISVSVYSILFGISFFQRQPYLKAGKLTKTFIDEFSITSRESEIIEHIIDGKSSKVIAENLCISPRTVTTHISNIYTKTNVKSRVQLINLFGSNWAK